MDIFDQLAETEVPPPPPTFDRTLHENLNRSLTSLHILDLFLRALPAAAIEFSRAVVGLLCHALSGQFPEERNKR